ncbi:MAG: fasciclin domain-containing protein [Gomphosphaeria aponina SAG 52.96 = DSM 107014]|uniref:Fasciclin domain-containing protein n=1 Tax=Gomphosphaeria aponina SAG 52.96 = DSM 107014 TaxID=1521640 RepID=A0A941GR93_9CHRO|nr:fasciclin domain-containing protein [Gomphosphaeria aponina SAG 52.96 = DSM 107014]
MVDQSNQPVELSQMEGTETPEGMEATEETATTVVDIAASSPDFETLTKALEAAGLVETLKGEGPFTVFAPTDDAFDALPAGTLDELLLPENKDKLVAVLTYHVVPGKVMSTDLTTGEVVTVEGTPVAIEVGETVMVNDATVLQADVEASNGVIHVIDKVILPAE